MIAVDSLLFLGEGPPFPEIRDGAMGQEYGECERDKVHPRSRPNWPLGASLSHLILILFSQRLLVACDGLHVLLR
jgi:hypothetical protein